MNKIETRLKRSLLTFLCVLFAWSTGLMADPAWQQHGKLQVSESGHAIQHDDHSPFLWIGDTAWGMFQQLTREEVDQYLDNRQELGFTVIQSVAYWYPHGGGIDSGPLNAANVYGHRPFAGGEDDPATAEPLIVEGGGPEAPNDYWDHADYVIEAVRKRNMYLALLPCWGRAYITTQMVGSEPEFTEEEARAYGLFLGKRYHDEPHIIWVLGGDAKAQIRGFDKNVHFQDWDKRPVFRAMAEGIVRGVTGRKAGWNKADPVWQQVFMTFHPDGDALDNSSNWFHQDAWLDANGVEVWREVDQVYPTMLRDYQLDDPVKPSLFLEGSYEFGSYRHECGWVTPLKVRRQVYHTFFAGGAGHTYGAGPIWPMRGNTGDYSCGYTWQQALEFPGTPQFTVVARAFLQQYRWFEWTPDGRVINSQAGEGESFKAAVTAESGNLALVYFSDNSAARIVNTLGTAAEARWFDPRNGQQEPAGRFEQDEIRSVMPPDRWEDAILVLQASKGQVTWNLDNLDTIAGNPVIVEGDPEVIDTPDGKAIQFDGVDDGIFLDTNPLAGMSEFTVEVIFRPDVDGAPEQRFFHMQEGDTDDRVMFETRLVENRDWFLDTFIMSGEQKIPLYAEHDLHPLNQWYHAAIVVDGKSFTHFVNGQKELSEPLDFEAMQAGKTSLGVRLNRVNWFKGAVRTARFTPRALSPEEFLTAGD